MMRSLNGLIPAILLLAMAASAARDSKPASTDYSKDELVQMAREVEADVARLRGWPFKHPVKTDVRDEQELRKFIEKRLFEEEMGGGKLEQTEAFLRLLGLIPKNCDLKKTVIDVLLNQVGGFYDPKTKAFYMLQRSGVSYGPFVNRILIAHELTHALDDQYLDLDALMKSHELTEDWGLAIGAVVEGSATQLMTAYSVTLMDSKKYDVKQLNDVAQDEMRRSQAFIQAPPYFRTLVASYLCGMFFVVRGEMAEIVGIDPRQMQKNMEALAKNPPRSAEQVLHPEKYWNPGNRDEPVQFDDAAIDKALESDGWKVVHRNTIGEVYCAQLAADPDTPFDMIAAASPTYWTNDAAKGWGGDRLFLMTRGSTEPSSQKYLSDARCIWITAWDSEVDRAEFIEDYESRRRDAGRRAWRLGDRIAIFTYGFADAEVEALKAKLGWDVLAPRKGDAVWKSETK